MHLRFGTAWSAQRRGVSRANKSSNSGSRLQRPVPLRRTPCAAAASIAARSAGQQVVGPTCTFALMCMHPFRDMRSVAAAARRAGTRPVLPAAAAVAGAVARRPSRRLAAPPRTYVGDRVPGAAAPAAPAASARPRGEIGFDDCVMLQAFGWDSCNKGEWYVQLHSKVANIKAAGFTHVWLPPPSQSVSAQGYLPGQLYNLNSKYGTDEDLKLLTMALNAASVAPMADIVINHRCADEKGPDGKYNSYRDDISHRGHRIDWGKWAITCNDPIFGGTGNPDTGDDYGAAPDLDHANPELREALKEWMGWLADDIGFRGWRFDFARGCAAMERRMQRSLGHFIPPCLLAFLSEDAQQGKTHPSIRVPVHQSIHPSVQLSIHPIHTSIHASSHTHPRAPHTCSHIPTHAHISAHMHVYCTARAASRQSTSRSTCTPHSQRAQFALASTGATSSGTARSWSATRTTAGSAWWTGSTSVAACRPHLTFPPKASSTRQPSVRSTAAFAMRAAGRQGCSGGRPTAPSHLSKTTTRAARSSTGRSRTTSWRSAMRIF
mmetsp:Transcript_5062/g.15337  ORF Transcript_5062/g.15337 Transcript_5062/m.15337 type:complete len:549 (-) Transcript_5062:926-2572(-)